MIQIYLPGLVTWVIMAGIGYLFSRRLEPPQKWWEWLAWLASLVVAGYIGPSARLISLPGFTIYINHFLQGLIFGLLAGFLVRPARFSRPE